MKGDRGFVLVNALILVAALSAVAVLLLSRSESGLARLDAGLTADQLQLNLDAFEAFAITTLARDLNGIDHGGEDWAQPLPPVDLAQGQITGSITDLQSRFNVNWLAIPGNTLAEEAFDRLLTRLGVSPETGRALRDTLQPGGPSDRMRWRQLDPPLEPRGGAILDLAQLRQVPGLSERSLDRLLPYLSAVPGLAPLNVNTAPTELLQAFFPKVPPAALARIVAQRGQEPFPSLDVFLGEIGIAVGEDAVEEADTDGDGVLSEEEQSVAEEAAARERELLERSLSVSSDWFRIEARTRLRGVEAERTSLLFREGRPATITVAWRRTVRP